MPRELKLDSAGPFNPKSILKQARPLSPEDSTLDLPSSSTFASSSTVRRPAASRTSSLPFATSEPTSMASRLHDALMSNEPSSSERKSRSSRRSCTPSSSSSSEPARKLALWVDHRGRKGGVWCHGCGETVAGLRFACDECLSFELCSTCFPTLDSSLQHPSTHHFQLQIHPALSSRFASTPVLLASQPSPSIHDPLPSSSSPKTVPQKPTPHPPRTPPPVPRPRVKPIAAASSSSEAPPAFPPPSFQGTFPALHIYPTSESFEPRFISLPADGCRIIIGRRKQGDTTGEPSSCNGYFDEKVLSRRHAEVWLEGGKIFICDLASLNGTHIQSEHLGSYGSGLSSKPRELRSGDLIDFGSTTNLKLSCKVVCVLSATDLEVSLRSLKSHLAFSRRLKRLQTQPSSSLVPSAASGPLPPPSPPPALDTRTHLPSPALSPADVRRFILVDSPILPDAKGGQEEEEKEEEEEEEEAWWSDRSSNPESDATGFVRRG